MRYLITGYKTNSEKQEIQDLGLYCYDLRSDDDSIGIATIEKNVVVNRIGTIITDEELYFVQNPYNFIEYEKFIAENEQVDKIEDLLSTKILNIEEQNYFAFCIGYDLLNNSFQNSNYPECDIVYEECQKLAKDFMKSKNYKDMTNSGYENLQNWIEDNKEKINNNYNKINYLENVKVKNIKER